MAYFGHIDGMIWWKLRSGVSGLGFPFIIYTCPNSWLLSPSHFSSPLPLSHPLFLTAWSCLSNSPSPPPTNISMKFGVWTTRTSMMGLMKWYIWVMSFGFVKGVDQCYRLTFHIMRASIFTNAAPLSLLRWSLKWSPWGWMRKLLANFIPTPWQFRMLRPLGFWTWNIRWKGSRDWCCSWRETIFP